MLYHDGFRDVDVGFDYYWIHAVAQKEKEIRCLTWKYLFNPGTSLAEVEVEVEVEVEGALALAMRHAT